MQTVFMQRIFKDNSLNFSGTEERWNSGGSSQCIDSFMTLTYQNDGEGTKNSY